MLCCCLILFWIHHHFGFVSALNFIFLQDTLYNTKNFQMFCSFVWESVPLLFCHKKNFRKLCAVVYRCVHYWRRVEKLLHVLCTQNPCRLFLLQSRYFVLLLHLILFTTTTTTVIHRFPLHNTPANCPSSSSPFSIQFKRFWIIYENIHKLQLNYQNQKGRECTAHMWICSAQNYLQ